MFCCVLDATKSSHETRQNGVEDLWLDDKGNICVLRTAHQLLLFNNQTQMPLDAKHLTIYLELGYTASFIAKLTGVHVKKVRRMMACHGMSCRNYTDISDSKLNNLVREIVQLDRG
ncbi:Uncharacterized protein APZ42_033567 [Daphnia magna]|uniref:Uncharacterized protein n=1 Tax=Daphnia magna TaxID=35525 RepID=A0A164KZB5_9CRUS|nr:Uncharacterized protein APZ42_033567 [Daphnia magna]